MNRSLGATAVLVLAATLACQEPIPPSRGGTYNFADTIPPDTIRAFHWPSDRLPVRFYAVPQGNLPLLVQRAVDIWAASFLYGEFTGVLVNDSTRADIIVAWTGTVPPDVPPDTGAAVFACQEFINLPAVDSATDRFTGPFHIYITVLGGSTPGQVEACVRRTMIHEVGHGLGLLLHSPAADDIMNITPTVNLPSEQDRRTVEVLYHTPATILPPP